MPEEPQGAKPAAKGFPMQYIILGGLVIGAALIALGFYQFVIAPKLAASPEATPDPAAGGIPLGAATATFERATVSVKMPSSMDGGPASLLIYKTALLCANQGTVDAVVANRPLFSDMFRKLHSNKERKMLDDPAVVDNIRTTALVEANRLLRDLQTSAPKGVEFKALRVLHEEFFVMDQ